MKSGLIILSLLALLLSGCSNNSSKQEAADLSSKLEQVNKEMASLKAENERLKTELDEITNGPDKLLAKASQYYKNKDLNGLNTTLANLKNKHPDAKEINTVLEMSKKLTSEKNKEKEEAKKKADAEAESKKRAEKAKAEEEKKRLAQATSKMRKKYDEITEVTWYHDKSTPQYINRNSFHIYVGTKDGLAQLRMEIQYAGDDWVFINSYIFKVDSLTINLDPAGEVKRDNDSGVWEYYDTQVYQKEYNLIKSIIASKKTIIRHQGDDHSYDRTVTAAEKKALQNVLDAYEALGGTEPAI
jgi:hypothetical protein